jgi:aspartyl-tRNA(Asn)/glutamyl-tRNA(Gln) amidotransferase subunit C
MNIEDLIETARLAHLDWDEETLARAFPAFEQMLGFFAAMQAADDDEAAFRGPIADLSRTAMKVAAGHFRPDLSPQDNPCQEAVKETLIGNAGEQDGRFIVIPNVL